jgi:glycosyltransferase involved in cell wall biosynthesis
MNGWLARTWASFSAWRLGFQQPALINYVPILAEAIPGWTGFKLYHWVDRWDAFGTYNSELMGEMDARCCRYSDAVAASSEDLLNRCLRHNPNVSLVLHGVDQAHFSRALEPCERPVDLPPGPVVGFFGLLSEWLDYPMILALAKAHPEAQVVLIGRADVDVEQLRGVANIHLLGSRPFRDLPRYIAHFTVGLIPFVINELTLAVNPIKLREMLAAGCPVVSTALPEVVRFTGRDGVRVAYSTEEFIVQVGLSLRQTANNDQRRAMSDAMKAETWGQKVSDLLELLPNARK